MCAVLSRNEMVENFQIHWEIPIPPLNKLKRATRVPCSRRKGVVVRRGSSGYLLLAEPLACVDRVERRELMERESVSQLALGRTSKSTESGLQ